MQEKSRKRDMKWYLWMWGKLQPYSRDVLFATISQIYPSFPGPGSQNPALSSTTWLCHDHDSFRIRLQQYLPFRLHCICHAYKGQFILVLQQLSKPQPISHRMLNPQGLEVSSS
ncbi:uncharacterized protein LOC119864989 isoform X2 [Canis lupus familiaris]|uniref:uncharacterized protein LOC119864989 isoform X2 n=1 Tax=Canis lupus familiaris TaxID=9615 RepID=UPI0018F63BCA|nr:uncharacterized protein LOC119864989 isoform X2 [Canis lupus familiaris]XP_038312343.1 uncharacterized protein LOC119864989 isoform X2 [Canis lupus familiaris]XP_038312344.1 uncharacterized protein LOC119864989 isoform X2 [Canis lupus familiaris]